MDNGASLADEKSMKCTETQTNICGKDCIIDSHRFVLEEVITDCTVEILKCVECGELSVGWYRQGVKHDLTTRGCK